MRLLGRLSVISAAIAAGVVLAACGTAASPPGAAPHRATTAQHAAHGTARPGAADAVAAAPAATSSLPTTTASATPTASTSPSPTPGRKLPQAGNPNGHAYVPPTARAVNTAHPTRVIGHGTAASCTSAAVVRAVAKGGVITFSCGPKPVTITMRATAKVVNTSKRVVLDGGGLVTLSGGGKRRILYMDTCDKRQVWTTDHCNDQATPRLTVQNLTFTRGNAEGRGPGDMAGGSGGAIFDEGGELTVVNSRFINNRCYAKGPDLGGAAIRAFEMYSGRPVYITRSTFSGGVCSNGGALSSIQVNWTVLNSLLEHNRAIGWGANPKSAGTPGGGSGGAIYTDGDNYNVTVNGTIIRYNHAREGGGAIFYVCDANCGKVHLRVEYSTLHDNPSAGFHNYPGTIFYVGSGKPVFIHSKLN